MTREMAPGWVLEIEESTVQHWVATCGDTLMVFAYEASHDDARHVYVGARAFEKLLQRFGRPVGLMFVVAPHGKPPSERVRKAFATVSRRLALQASRAAVVIEGTGFISALHRGAASGLLTLLRPKFPVSIVGTTREGLDYLLGPRLAEVPALITLCGERSKGPEVGVSIGDGLK